MAFTKPSPEAMREEFHRLTGERDKIMADAAPYREAYEAKRVELADRELRELKPLEEKMKKVETPLYQINQDIADLSRWLKGKTGAPSE